MQSCRTSIKEQTACQTTFFLLSDIVDMPFCRIHHALDATHADSDDNKWRCQYQTQILRV